jgi:hypothetical protein
MIYPGDMCVFTLPIENADGSTPVIDAEPTIMVLNLLDGSVAWAAQPMVLIAGTTIYKAIWPTFGTPDGTYLATVSYIADSITFNNRHLTTIRLGDSRVTGEVAKEATTSKEATAAKDETVLHLADYVAPDASTVLQAVASKLSGYPAQIPSANDVTVLQGLVTDIRDSVLGHWLIDRIGRTLTMRRPGSDALLKTFSLTKNGNISERIPQ